MELDLKELFCCLILSAIIGFSYRKHVAPSQKKYLTFWPRFWAPTIDELILWIPTTLVPYSVSQIFNYGEPFKYILHVTVWFVYFSYSICFHYAFGATIGKMTTKVVVVDANTEGPMSLKQALLRDSIPVVLSFGVLIFLHRQDNNIENMNSSLSDYMALILLIWFLAEIITMLTNRKRRALHDYIAGTVVIRKNIEF